MTMTPEQATWFQGTFSRLVDNVDKAVQGKREVVSLVLASMPGQRYDFSVLKITPVSTAKEGRNFFRVEADLGASADARLRPGMEGAAKIVVDERNLAWIWARRLIDWVRLKSWAWLP